MAKSIFLGAVVPGFSYHLQLLRYTAQAKVLGVLILSENLWKLGAQSKQDNNGPIDWIERDRIKGVFHVH